MALSLRRLVCQRFFLWPRRMGLFMRTRRNFPSTDIRLRCGSQFSFEKLDRTELLLLYFMKGRLQDFHVVVSLLASPCPLARLSDLDSFAGISHQCTHSFSLYSACWYVSLLLPQRVKKSIPIPDLAFVGCKLRAVRFPRSIYL